MRGRDQLRLTRMDLEVVHRHVRQTGHELGPRGAAVHRDVRAHIRAREEQVAVLRVLAHHVHEVGAALGQTTRDRSEGAAAVGGHDGVRREVTAPMVVVRDVEGVDVVMRRLDARHVRAGRYALHVRGEFRPRTAVVPGRPEAAVVGAGVQVARADRRLVERRDRAERLSTGRVDRDAPGRPGGDAELRRVGVAQVVGDRVHLVAALDALHDTVGAEVEHLVVVRGDEERRVPVPAQLHRNRIGPLLAAQFGEQPRLGGRGGLGRVATDVHDAVLPHHVLRAVVRLLERGALAGRDLIATDVAALRLPIDDVGVRRVLCGDEAVAAVVREPHRVGDPALPATAWAAPRTVVLQARADAVGDRHVERDVVRLSEREGVREDVAAAVVVRDADAAVVTDDVSLRILGVDPHRMMIDVDADRRVARVLAALVGDLHGRGREPDAVGVGRVHAHLVVIEGAHVVVGRLLPRGAAVGRAIEPARHLLRLGAGHGLGVRERVGFDHRVDDRAIGRREDHVDATLHGRREAAALHLGPGVSAVGGAPECRAHAARTEEVRAADALVARREHDVRVTRVERDVDEAGGIIDELLEFPRGTTVGGLVEPALLVARPRRTEGRDPGHVRVGRVHDDSTDVLRLLEPHELPREAAVGRLEDAAAGGDRVARVGLAGAEVHHHGVARRDREVAERGHPVVLEHRAKGRAVVRRLPDATSGGGNEERPRRVGDAFDVGDAAHHVRGTDLSPTEGVDDGLVDGLREGRNRG